MMYDVTNHSAGVFWRTSGPANASVQYGLNSSLLETVSNSTLDSSHRIILSGLASGTTYYYKVVSDGNASLTYHFKTAPLDGQAFKVLIFGDNRPAFDVSTEPAEFVKIVNLTIAEEPSIVILVGDYVYSVTTDDASNNAKWSAFEAIIDKLGHYAPVYGAIGNHDAALSTGTVRIEYFLHAFEQDNMPSPYYCFDYAGVRFVILDTEASGPVGRITGAQLIWLKSTLETAGSHMKFVVAHEPMYPISHIGSSLDTNITERDALQQLFESTNVTVFAAGHDHLFNRMTVNGMVHVITGGGGAPLYPSAWGGAFFHYTRFDVSKDSVNISAIGLDSQVKENYKLPYTGPIEIFLRVVANTSQSVAGTLPSIYFSHVPAQKFYSWDGGSNATVLTGFPGAPGQHILDVYARNSTGAWSHARFVFTTAGTTSSTTTTTTPSQPSGMLAESILLVGVAGVVTVVILWLWLRSRKPR